MIEYKQRGQPTYRYYYILDVFESEKEIVDRWDNDIKFKLDDYAKEWFLKINRAKTDYSKLSITLIRTFYYETGHVKVEVGMYRDGFHIGLYDTSDLDLKYNVFGQINRSQAWTQEVAKVAPITNEIIAEIKKYIAKKKNK